jgi:methylmalonyl-CoA/ethylmalonyl-CoA epimerase|tara:strand:+ start:6443 stop:6877 length:435 start_codon:yes stop_codon:yes gene_type:complete
MVIEVRHIGIVVKNIENSLKFYRDILELEIQRTMDESGDYINNMLGLENVKVKTVKLSAPSGPTLVELLEFSNPEGNPLSRNVHDLGASHVAFTVSNIDEIYQKLTESGVKFNAPPQLSPDGYAKVTFCLDPDNTPVELVQVLN